MTSSEAVSKEVIDKTGTVINAPLSGNIFKIEYAEGSEIKEDDTVIVLEAMKMEHALRAPFPGVVTQLAGTAGQQVVEGTTLLVLERLEED